MELRAGLEILKVNASNAVKNYNDRPSASFLHEDLVYTYVTESTVVGPQDTLTVSHTSKKAFELDENYTTLFNEVFGEFPMRCSRVYMMRGYSIQYVRASPQPQKFHHQ